MEHTVKELVPETTWPLVQVLNRFRVVFVGTVILAGRIGDWSKYREYCHNCVESIAGVLSKDVQFPTHLFSGKTVDDSFSSLQPTDIATTFHINQPSDEGIIREQIRKFAEDELESRIVSS